MTERDMWLIVRRALLMIVRAIEARYGLGQGQAASEPAENVSVTYTPGP